MAERDERPTEHRTARPVSDRYKIQGNSLPEIRRAWKQVALDHIGDAELEAATDGALQPGNVLNALVLWCLSRPEAEQRRILVWGLRALERLKDSPNPVDLRKISREDFGSLGVDIDGSTEGHPNRKTGGHVAAKPDARRSRRRTG